MRLNGSAFNGAALNGNSAVLATILADFAVTQASGVVSSSVAVSIAALASLTSASHSGTMNGTSAVTGGAILQQSDFSILAWGYHDRYGSVDVTQQDESLTAAGAAAIGGDASLYIGTDWLTSVNRPGLTRHHPDMSLVKHAGTSSLASHAGTSALSSHAGPSPLTPHTTTESLTVH